MQAPLISVIVPALDEAGEIAALLDHLAGLEGRWEVIVCDGGSSDATAALAADHPLAPRVLRGARGRSRQQNLGATAARGDALLFLHADSRLPAGAYRSLEAALAQPGCPGGNFALRFDGDDAFSWVLTAWYAVQRRFGTYYGDSSLWVRSDAWAALGGFRELPIMEDHDLVQRLERMGGTRCLPGPAITSSRRWRRLGVRRTLLSWVVIRLGWHLGVPPSRLAGLYRRGR